MNPSTEGDRYLPTSVWRPLVLVVIPISSFGQAPLNVPKEGSLFCYVLLSSLAI